MYSAKLQTTCIILSIQQEVERRLGKSARHSKEEQQAAAATPRCCRVYSVLRQEGLQRKPGAGSGKSFRGDVAVVEPFEGAC